ncbi:hypothetical protein AB0G60_18430 [Streptomyces angustmyceticus]|uniref:Uncharacterized protein n=1 Tax=Streptomyces angustmyceticus TaxID=285578 RepID=A0A5J4L8A4_9ACTN|nr:hypothetical protein [Streptomyces angustmyceticus]UAL67299.1 hypothetical protein K7396_12740 [Streptomyces angustmyceticus]GES30383.1 hypothetical protein San01_28700 [Streptomyces angustmyceticus]
MSLQDELTAVERSLDGLVRSVGRLEAQLDACLDIRRLRSDTDHLRESLTLLKQSVAAGPPRRPGVVVEEMVTISDAPYNAALWTDAEDEGLGSRNGHAP